MCSTGLYKNNIDSTLQEIYKDSTEYRVERKGQVKIGFALALFWLCIGILLALSKKASKDISSRSTLGQSTPSSIPGSLETRFSLTRGSFHFDTEI